MDINENNFNVESLKDMVQGKHTSQTKIQVSVGEYNPTVTRKVGDTWTDSEGVQWEQKEGYAARIESEWRKEVREQLYSFPNCRKESCTCFKPNRFDKKMRTIHGMCFDCVIDMEHKLKLEGKYKEYEKEKMKQNALAWLREAEADKDAIIEEMTRSMTFVTADGDVEKWKNNVNPDELRQKIEEEFLKLKNEILSNFEVDT